ncbi:MAG: 3'-5' exonuclease [Candidatus Xenobia bacterium]
MRFAFLDLELTGLQPGVDRVIEVAVRLETPQQELILAWERLVNPQRPVAACDVHGIEDGLLSSQAVFAALAPELAQILQDAYVVGYHVAVDREFLMGEFQRAGVLLQPAGWLDVRRMARHRGGLGELAKQVGVTVGERHRAAPDAALTREVFWRLYCGQKLERLLLPSLQQAGVIESLLARRGEAVTIRYDRGRGEKRFTLVPLSIDGGWLTARTKTRTAPRRYRLERIIAVDA